MKNPPSVDVFERSAEQANEWLAELSLLLGVHDDAPGAYGALRSVLHALRDRLPLIAGVRLGAQLPTVLRGVYYEGFQPDRGHVHTRTLGEFLALVERETPHASVIPAEEKTRAVFNLLGSHLESAELERVIGALPEPVRDLFPSVRGPVGPTAPRLSIRLPEVRAKSA